MSTLADPNIQSQCRERIARLEPHTPRRWGKMTAHQMVCHLNDSFRVGTGEKYASPATSFFQRTVIKWAALHTSVKWPQGSPTRPEVEQGRGGTPPSDWERDRAELQALVLSFPRQETFGSHPLFGEMNANDWLIWGYRHLDHHLRQFGV